MGTHRLTACAFNVHKSHSPAISSVLLSGNTSPLLNLYCHHKEMGDMGCQSELNVMGREDRVLVLLVVACKNKRIA